jgi:2-dehydro-3-deoxyphosphogalactonate aldolase
MIAYLDQFPFVAITRGITPPEAGTCAEILFAAGFRIMETPLNSPDPYKSISKMVAKLGHKALIGACTGSTVDQVEQVAAAEGMSTAQLEDNAKRFKKSWKDFAQR